jgi:hypothetical protein
VHEAGQEPAQWASVSAGDFTPARAHYPELTLSEVRHGAPPLPSSCLNPMFEALSDAGLPA